MKKVLFLALTLFSISFVFAQAPIVEATTWSQSFSKTTVTEGETIEVIFTAPLKKGNHVYSNKFDYTDCGPQKAKMTYDPKDMEIIGDMKAINPRFYEDEIWVMVCGPGKVSDFDGKAEFRQKVKITGANPSLKGKLDYQICNDRGCLSYDHEYSLSGLTVKPAPKADVPKDDNPTTKPDKNDSDEGSTDQNPVADEDDPDPTNIEGDTADSSNSESSSKDTNDTEESTTAKSPDDENDLKDKSLWALFLLGAGGGLIALVTPCVFPMIPMTVAFFNKEADRKKAITKALVYGASIVGIYLILGLILAKIFDERFTYYLSTHWLPNMLFFAIFVFFSLSFFGMFELTLPSSFVNKMDAKGDKGGYLGIFFIAFTLVLVSFSCTVPIVGSVSILAAGGETIRPLVAMLGFALIFAFPFVLFAIFPAWLNSLPKSGGWLNSVKVILGFIELALALKFFSQADLVYNWGILDRDVFIAIWVVLAFLMGVYLLGKIKFPHDSDLPRIPVPRFLIAVLVFSFGLWMLPGMWGAPLKPLAGILPPITTQDYNVMAGGIASSKPPGETIRFSDKLKLPHNLTGYFTMKDAVAKAKELDKPIFIDFTGKSCANCRKMEEYVWPEEEVLSRLNNDFVIASLYCDAWTIELPEDEWVQDKDGNTLKSLGDINSKFQIDQFGSNGQPYYYVVDHDLNVLSVFAGYKKDPPLYIEFLDEGKNAYKAQK